MTWEVKRLATKGAIELIEGASLSDEDTNKIEGTGKNGTLTKSDIEAYLKSSEETEETEETSFPTLLITGNGWCEALGRSYRAGRFQAKTQKEFDAMKPFAKKG